MVIGVILIMTAPLRKCAVLPETVNYAAVLLGVPALSAYGNHLPPAQERDLPLSHLMWICPPSST